jgi:hypothetical protein
VHSWTHLLLVSSSTLAAPAVVMLGCCVGAEDVRLLTISGLSDIERLWAAG